MRYYLIKEKNENKIMKVQDDCIDTFQLDYAGKILFAADTIQQILMMINECQPLADQVHKASEKIRAV